MRAVDCSAWSGSRAGVAWRGMIGSSFETGNEMGICAVEWNVSSGARGGVSTVGGEVSKYAGVVRSAKARCQNL